MARSIIAALFFGLAAAQTTTLSSTASPASNALTILAGNGVIQGGSLAASVIGGDACRTTYELKCVASRCGSGLYSATSGFAVTVTEGPYFQQFSTSIATGGAAASIFASCAISGRTSATCVASISVSALGTSTATSTTATYSVKYNTITATAGTVPTGSCTSTGNAALPTNFVDVYKVAVVPAAALAAAVLI